MIKLFRFLLLLCMLQVSGCMQHFGGYYQGSACHSCFMHSEWPALIGFVAGESSQKMVVRSAVPDAEKGSRIHRATIVEEKEEESVSFKKHLKFGHDLHTTFYNRMSRHFCQYVQRRSFSCAHLLYLPSCKHLYLLLEAFRI